MDEQDHGSVGRKGVLPVASPAVPEPTSRERPILFSAPMVRAILAGKKTQTRRVVKRLPLRWLDEDGFTPDFVASRENHFCPYGYAGDRLWVRERFHRTTDGDPILFGYDVPGEDRELDVPGHGRVREFGAHLGGWGGRLSRNFPSIHMPRWASRITLDVTDVRIERLNDISEADALAEGCEAGMLDDGFDPQPLGPDGWTISSPGTWASAAGKYQILWEDIHGEWSWLDNPWVWVVSFAPPGASQHGDNLTGKAAQRSDSEPADRTQNPKAE